MSEKVWYVVLVSSFHLLPTSSLLKVITTTFVFSSVSSSFIFLLIILYLYVHHVCFNELIHTSITYVTSHILFLYNKTIKCTNNLKLLLNSFSLLQKTLKSLIVDKILKKYV